MTEGQSPLIWKSAVNLRGLLHRKEISPVELLNAVISRIHKTEPYINAFTQLDLETAMKEARLAEELIVKNEVPGLLHGLPISIKDVIPVRDLRLTYGSRLMATNISKIDAIVVQRLREQGAIIIGKTTTSEFGCKGVSDAPLTGITRNPWNLNKTAGGSSGGAAASVAAGVTPFAVGTDGGGSLRIPAAFCGIFGFKPHFGRIPIYPTSLTPTLGHVGPLTRTVEDAALFLQATAGYDARDSFSVAQKPPDFLEICRHAINGMKIAWSPNLGYGPDLQMDVRAILHAAVRVFERLGAIVTVVDKVMDEDPIEIFTAEFYTAVSIHLGAILEKNSNIIDQSIIDLLERARKQTLRGYYEKNMRRYELRSKVAEFFSKYDLLLTPTVPVTAFDVGRDYPDGYETVDNLLAWICYTYPFNLTGLPAASIPVGFGKNGLPVGLQIIGRGLGEADVLRAAAAFERAQPWAHLRPPI